MAVEEENRRRSDLQRRYDEMDIIHRREQQEAHEVWSILQQQKDSQLSKFEAENEALREMLATKEQSMLINLPSVATNPKREIHNGHANHDTKPLRGSSSVSNAHFTGIALPSKNRMIRFII